ncbi:hypothetical protein SELMODRAFT_420096 [Selaginella moellendorffii]|uniref:Uncharacterized protein n=1 Tax=Selaginella moellendorffii TaxID=88036 RepID=D8SAY9_SELML|nr:hypothetical protein SELMODRAFT_420096 [Selaginella moellendorffii]
MAKVSFFCFVFVLLVVASSLSGTDAAHGCVEHTLTCLKGGDRRCDDYCRKCHYDSGKCQKCNHEMKVKSGKGSHSCLLEEWLLEELVLWNVLYSFLRCPMLEGAGTLWNG